MENIAIICIVLVCAISAIIWIYLQFKNAATCIEDENGNIIGYITVEDKQEMLTCEGWKMSNCCGAKIEFADVCSECKEHADTSCSDCEIYNECNNENKPNLD